jgi:hypothetical protein
VLDIWMHLYSKLSEAEWCKVDALIRVVSPDPETRVLRNISRRQYVSRSALTKLRESSPKNWHLESVDLGHIVCSRICWSSDGSVAMSYDEDIHRGIWAGDRFDITSADALEETDENGQSVEWKDVSEEVMEEMSRIWSSEYD